jgi:hypothetical protein
VVIESCAKEIERLVGLRAQRPPALIREQDARIKRLLSTLHVIRPRPEHGDDFQVIFDRNEEELKGFTEFHRKMGQIGYMEDMLLELRAAKAEPGNTPHPKDEQRKRRMRTLLPRLEKKLYLILVEFREVNDRRLEWDAEPYINGLAHIKSVEKTYDRQTTRRRIVVIEWPAKFFTEKPSQSTILHVDRLRHPAICSMGRVR